MVLSQLFSEFTERPDHACGAHLVPSGGILRILPLRTNAQGNTQQSRYTYLNRKGYEYIGFGIKKKKKKV